MLRSNCTANSGKVMANSKGIKVWDLPLRLFHWGVAACFGAAWLTSGDRWLDFHVFTGYLLGGLLLFRLYWGLYGEPNARFRDFVFGWSTVRSYLVTILRGRPDPHLGHNPAGSWAIWLIFLLLLLLVVTGLLTFGGEERHGPFAGWLGFSAGAVLHRIHEVLAWVMVGVVAVHLCGILVESLLHRENLVVAMITGDKRWQGSAVPVRSRGGVAMLLLAFPLLFAAVWFKGYLLETEEQPYLPFVGPDLADNPLWREECGGCHLAYHPSLLPARSWVRMMEQQADHFGEDLALEQDEAEAILGFQTANSSEQAATEAAWKINRDIPAHRTPLRITETDYWKRKHREIEEEVWDGPAVNGRWNCDACHLDADRGTFEDGAMRIPD
jgi:cytochrome b